MKRSKRKDLTFCPIMLCRSNLEYKYVVANSPRTSVRWQTGPNCELKVSSRGGLLEVEDSWGQETRVRRELGLPAAAATHGFAAPCEVPPAAANGSALSDQGFARNGYKVKQSVVEVINLPVASVAPLDEPGQYDYPVDFLSAPQAGTTFSTSSSSDEDFLDFAAALLEEQGVLPDSTAAVAAAAVTDHDVAALLPGMGAELQQALDDLAGSSATIDVVARQTLEEGLRVLQQLQQEHQAMLNILRPATPEPGMTSSSSGSSGKVALHSHDELACALLSDDCEEACNCMVDALCACQAENADHCYCPEDLTAAVAAVSETPALAAAVSSAPPLPPSPQDQQQQHQYDVVSEDSQQLMSLATVAADVEAQERRLEDVQAAIERSMALLDQLRDPAHPLVLAADRGLAMAHRGSDRVRLSAGNTVKGHLWVPAAGAL